MNNSTIKKRTPWGTAQTTAEIALGIVSYKTASHGGFHVSAELNKLVPAALKNSTFGGLGHNGWYEEDNDWAIVVYIFKQHFEPELYNSAVQCLEQHYSEAWKQIFSTEN